MGQINFVVDLAKKYTYYSQTMCNMPNYRDFLAEIG